MKKLTTFLLTILLGASFVAPVVLAQETESNEQIVTIEVLERSDCQHCLAEKAFLEQLQQTRNDIEVTFLDIDEEQNRQLWESIAELEGIPKVTPITLIGNQIIQGFDKAETTGRMFEQVIEVKKEVTQLTFQQIVDQGGLGNVTEIEGATCDEDSETCAIEPYTPLYFDVPFMGQVDVKTFSLPTLSIVLGFIDGFNPCAMWVLVTFLLILVQIGDRKRMWQIAGLFILAEAVMYYLILNVWYSVWDFVGLDNIVTPIVGIIAIGGGMFFLSEWRKGDGTCNVTNIEQRKKTRSRIQKLATAEMTLITIIGIIGLALSVNIIEFACSIGIPQAFTKILEINNLGVFSKHLYIALYILFYMVDDFLVFGIALYSIEKIGLTSKYANWCHLIGGVLMLILGALLIFAPDLLV